MYNDQKNGFLFEWVSEWLLLSNFQIYNGKNKLQFGEICTRPTRLVEFSYCYLTETSVSG